MSARRWYLHWEVVVVAAALVLGGMSVLVSAPRAQEPARAKVVDYGSLKDEMRAWACGFYDVCAPASILVWHAAAALPGEVNARLPMFWDVVSLEDRLWRRALGLGPRVECSL